MIFKINDKVRIIKLSQPNEDYLKYLNKEAVVIELDKSKYYPITVIFNDGNTLDCDENELQLIK